ncbi:MAG: hypothetical protein KAJ73_07055 [Zetaproteobacteria bacterium]|nr:hypothetical protein [Zetaproteobacteria bacterium]
MSDTPSERIDCIGERFDQDAHCVLRMLHYPDVDVTCEVCGATTKSDEFISGIYRGHVVRHGSQADIIEHDFPWSCSSCGTQSKYAYFYCDSNEEAWNTFFGINKADKINNDADDT